MQTNSETTVSHQQLLKKPLESVNFVLTIPSHQTEKKACICFSPTESKNKVNTFFCVNFNNCVKMFGSSASLSRHKRSAKHTACDVKKVEGLKEIEKRKFSNQERVRGVEGELWQARILIAAVAVMQTTRRRLKNRLDVLLRDVQLLLISMQMTQNGYNVRNVVACSINFCEKWTLKH